MTATLDELYDVGLEGREIRDLIVDLTQERTLSEINFHPLEITRLGEEFERILDRYRLLVVKTDGAPDYDDEDDDGD
jgi:hypothetical protein